MRCKKCNVIIDSPSNICPLCNTYIENKNEETTYPKISTRITSNLIRRIMLFILLFSSFVVLIINYLVTPNIKWSRFVILALISTYLLTRTLMKGRNNKFKFILTINILIIILSLIWDYYTGNRGWAINYVYPGISIIYGVFLIILRIISYYTFKRNSTYVYINIILQFIPLILLFTKTITFMPLSIISGLLGIANLLILVLFDGKRFKEDLEKKLHL